MSDIQNDVTSILCQEKERFDAARWALLEQYDDVLTNCEENGIIVCCRRSYMPEPFIAMVDTGMPLAQEFSGIFTYLDESRQINAKYDIFKKWCLNNSSNKGDGVSTLGYKDYSGSVFHADIINSSDNYSLKNARIIVCGCEKMVSKSEITYEEYQKEYVDGLEKILELYLGGLSSEEKDEIIRLSCDEVMSRPLSKRKSKR